MNAPASTLQVLSGSSLVGSLTSNTLQLYTGSITSSAVQIGPYFDILTESAPILASVSQTINTAPVAATISIACGAGLTSISNDGGFRAISVFASNPTTSWTATVDYEDGYGWIGFNDSTGTGNGQVTFTVSGGPLISGYSVSRTAIITITNDQNSTNNYYCFVTQFYYEDSSSGNGYPSQIP
jgi:hypothetical protein